MYLALLAVFGFILLDDSLKIHEQLGILLGTRLDLPALGGLHPRDLGEILVWALAGLPLLGAVLATLVRAERDDRRNALLLLAALGLLASFAVGADVLHVIFTHAFGHAEGLLAVLEEGGEQFVQSLIVVLVILIRRDVCAREAAA